MFRKLYLTMNGPCFISNNISDQSQSALWTICDCSCTTYHPWPIWPLLPHPRLETQTMMINFMGWEYVPENICIILFEFLKLKVNCGKDTSAAFPNLPATPKIPCIWAKIPIQGYLCTCPCWHSHPFTGFPSGNHPCNNPVRYHFLMDSSCYITLHTN